MIQDKTIAEISTEPRPCDDCSKYDHCKAEQLACQDFLFYTLRGKVRNKYREPSEKTFKKAFSGDQKTKP